MPVPFAILALPRSRTAWLSAWLTDGDRVCYHEALGYAHTRDTLRRLAADRHGLAETSGLALPRVLHSALPDANYLVVRRDPQQVIASLDRLGALGARASVRAGETTLNDAVRFLSERAHVMDVRYEELNDLDCLRAVWRFLRGDAHDEARTRRFMAMRITKINPFDGIVPHELLREEREMRGLLA